MARIRLRHCTVRFVDGWAATAKVAAAATPQDADAFLDFDTLVIDNPTTDTLIPALVRFTVADTDEIYQVTSVTSNATAGALNENPLDLAVDVDVDGFTGVIPTGTTFTVDGSSATHTVTGHTEDVDGNTVNIEFTPMFEAATTGLPIEDAVVTFSSSQYRLNITPALSTAATLPVAGKAITFYGRAVEIKVGDGNLTWDTARNLEYEMDKGEIDAVVEGDDIPVDLSLDLTYEYLTAVSGTGIPTAEDVLKQRGEASSWVTAGADPCEVYAVAIEVDYAPPCNYKHEISTFPEFRWETISHDIGQATLSVQGKCKVTDITTVRRDY